ncbi:hypothetical protein K6W16_25345 [Burkholderia dolosa]|uniref:Uncharacterized protein n=1 Tax=Burkholderia dolosa TaxID=152500 RepID=A0A892ID78_9BURK|nr:MULTISPECIES: hypothetical protein [Burkholderia]MBR8302126.1 hypothetical protein [Burkholderia dolosa]MBR8416170.1 hypothetical protein [Burkholderia dolosa]MBY4655653.1 hypothetical protein [Burkholderia dolosa]MBY4688005.1 hypothetical protein [Burkholderia dolosa]MBY4753313.1 hypothetical protein [Burkholderia dolosa]
MVIDIEIKCSRLRASREAAGTTTPWKSTGVFGAAGEPTTGNGRLAGGATVRYAVAASFSTGSGARDEPARTRFIMRKERS